MPSQEGLVVTLAMLPPNATVLKQLDAMQLFINSKHRLNINQTLTFHECSFLMPFLIASTPTPSAFQALPSLCSRLQVFYPNPLQLSADAPFISAQNPHPSVRPSLGGCLELDM